MAKTRLAIVLLFCTTPALADDIGRVTAIGVDSRPCVFFQTNGGPTWYGISSTDPLVDLEYNNLSTSKVVPGQNVYFYQTGVVNCGDGYYPAIKYLTLY